MAGDGKAVLAARMARLFSEFGSEPAALFHDRWFEWSYVARVDAGIAMHLGDLDADATVAVVLRQRPWCLAAVLALLGQGRAAVLVSPIQPSATIASEIEALRPAAVVADVEDWDRAGITVACAAVGALGCELRDDSERPLRLRADLATLPAIVTRVPDGAAVTALTSGTTGTPKRLAIAWDDLVPDEAAVRDPGSRRGAMINALPLFSIGGILAMVSTVFGGRPIALLDRFDVKEWASLIKRFRPRRAGAPPAVLQMVLESEIPPSWFDSVQAFYTASAPLSPEVAERFETTYGIPVIQGYGATEFLGAVTGWGGDLHRRYGADKRGSVGRPLPGVQLRVVDPTSGAILGAGEVGNLEVDAPNRARGVPPGWVRTNDLARIDDDGFVWILGRTDDVIIRGGFKVALGEVETVLRSHPHVSDACVVGMPDDRLGEVPQAVVVVAKGATVSDGELIEWVKASLAPYAAPTAIRVVDEIPLNWMMKKDRMTVREVLRST